MSTISQREPCKHDGDWVQMGQYTTSPFQCEFCSLQMSPAELAMYLQMKKIEWNLIGDRK